MCSLWHTSSLLWMHYGLSIKGMYIVHCLYSAYIVHCSQRTPSETEYKIAYNFFSLDPYLLHSQQNKLIFVGCDKNDCRCTGQLLTCSYFWPKCRVAKTCQPCQPGWCYFFWPMLIFGKSTRKTGEKGRKQTKTRENRRFFCANFLGGEIGRC